MMEDISSGYLKEMSMQTKTINDSVIGELIFPEYDNVISELIIKHGTWEPTEQEWIKNNVFPGSVVYNLGANIGYHSIVSSISQNGNGRVVAVEASKDLCSIIEENCINKKIVNIEVLNLAITDHNGEDTIYYSVDNCGDNRISNSNAGNKSEKIKSVTATELINIVGEYPDVIIMDIQGWETEVLASMPPSDKKILCLFEFTPSFIEQMGMSVEKEISRVISTGWQIKTINNQPISLYDIFDQYLNDPTPNNFFMNLIAER